MKKTTVLHLFGVILISILLSAFTAKSHKSLLKANHAKFPWSHAIMGGTNYPDQDNPPATVAAFYYNTNHIPYPAKRDDLISPICTGSFINAKFVLTAKHCVTDFRDTSPLDLESLYIVYRKKPESDTYVAIGIKNIILYEKDPKLDIALVELKEEYPNLPNPVSMLYHGYELHAQTELSQHKLIEYGYGVLWQDHDYGGIEENYMSTLKMLEGFPYLFISYQTELLMISDEGTTTGGDSGGPITYDGYLMSVHHSGRIQGSLNYSAILTQDVLKWLATSIKSPIFKTPLSYGYLKESNNSIIFTGWGPISPNTILTVPDLEAEVGDVIGYCNDFIITGDDQWSCQVDLEKTPDPNEYYNALLIDHSSRTVVDSVQFLMNSDGRDLKILEPEPNIPDDDMYTFIDDYYGFPPYTVKGSGTPGDTVKFKVTRLKDGFTELDSCNFGNETVISENGLWECRLTIQTQATDESYEFEASVPDDKENSNKIVITTTKFKIKVLTESITIETDPAESSTVYGDHLIEIKLSHIPPGNLFEGMTSRLQVDGVDDNVYASIIQRESDGTFTYVQPSNLQLVDSSYIPDVSLAKLSIWLNYAYFKHNLIKVINYYIFNYRVFIASLANNEEVVPNELKISGGSNLGEANKNPDDYFIQVIIQLGNDSIEYCNTQLKKNGDWSCPKDNNSLLQVGDVYSVHTYLIRKSDDKCLSINSIYIKTIDPVAKVNISTPISKPLTR